MLGIEYFGNLEHCCFEKNVLSDSFSRSVMSCKFRCKLVVKSGEWRHNSLFLTFRIFSVPIFCLFGIF